jgi:hypothetical protein
MKMTINGLSEVANKVYDLLLPLTEDEAYAVTTMAMCVYHNVNNKGEGYDPEELRMASMVKDLRDNQKPDKSEKE